MPGRRFLLQGTRLLPSPRRAFLPLTLFLPLLLFVAGGRLADGRAAGAAPVEHGERVAPKSGAPVPAYLGSSLTVLAFDATQEAGARKVPEPGRGRITRDAHARSLLSQESRARSTRLERLDFASVLAAASSGRRSLHPTAHPPPSNA